jgi:hypothetical protein
MSWQPFLNDLKTKSAGIADWPVTVLTIQALDNFKFLIFIA